MRYLLPFILLITFFLTPTASAAPTLPALEPGACPFEMSPDLTVTCGYLLVPENRAVPNSRTIRLPYAILHSRAAAPQPDPIIYTSSGGPGYGAFGAWKHLAYNFPFLETRDILLLEQRGTRWADPYLACPEINQVMFENLTLSLDRPAEIAREVEAALACRDALLAQGIDLRGYTTLESAADLEDFRALLGLEQWNFIGTSYATRIALTLMRLAPNSLRAVVLDSVYDPSVSYLEQRVPTYANVLQTLFAQCAADAKCGTAYPNLPMHWQAVIARANHTPIPVTIRHPKTAEPLSLTLRGDDLTLGVFNAMRDARLLPLLPFLIEELYAGNLDIIVPIAQNGFAGMFNTPLGMYYAVECAEEYPFSDPVRQQEIAHAYLGFENFLPTPSDPAVCAAWNLPAVDPSFREPVSSATPTLIFHGELDAVLPPAELGQRLPNAYTYTLPGLPHAVMDFDACARQMADAFLENPAQAPDGLCTPGQPTLNFLTQADIFTTPLFYHLNEHLFAHPNLPVIISVGLLSLFIIWGVWISARYIVQKKYLPFAFAVGASVFLGILFIGGLTFVMFTTDPLLLGFGLPGEWAWLSALPWWVGGALLLAGITQLPTFKRPQ